MTKEIEPDLNFDEGFDSGYEAGKIESEEDVMDRLEDGGFDPEEIEALFDPAPRRRRGRRKTRRSKVRHPALVYDPAPRRRRWGTKAQKYGRRAKGVLGKVRKYVMPGTAALTFYAAYAARAKEQGKGVFETIMDDVKNFNGEDAMKRLQDKAPTVLGSTVGGWLVKKFAPGNLKLIGDVLMGIGIGTAGKAVLDPPALNSGGSQNAKSNCGSCIKVETSGVAQQNAAAPMMVNNPYASYGSGRW